MKYQRDSFVSSACLSLAKRRDCLQSIEWTYLFFKLYGGIVALKFHYMNVFYEHINHEKDFILRMSRAL